MPHLNAPSLFSLALLPLGLLGSSLGVAPSAMAQAAPAEPVQTDLPWPETNGSFCPMNETCAPMRFPANETLPRYFFGSRRAYLSRIAPDAQLISFQLLSYRDYLALDSSGISMEVAPGRMVIHLVMAYPNGVEAQPGHYGNATVSQLFDGVTGQLISEEVIGRLEGERGDASGDFLQEGSCTISTRGPC
jgi:hypothetical protein